MTKLCPIILNNEAVTVIRFDDIEVQLPSIHKNVKSVYVKYDDGKYTIVENIEDEKEEVVISHKKRNQKKTTVENTTVIETKETVTDTE